MLKISDTTKKHLLAHPGVEDLIEHAYSKLLKTGLIKPWTPLPYKFQNIIGNSECLEVKSVKDDELILCQRRIGRDKWSRAVEDSPVPCDTLTMIVGKDNNLITAYVGHPAPREPWDKSMNESQRRESVEFWRKNALCLQPGAVTTVMTFKDFCDGN